MKMEQNPKHNPEDKKPITPANTEHKAEAKAAPKDSGGNNKKIIIGLSVIFILILAIQFYFNHTSQKELKTEIEDKGVEIDGMLVQMDSLSTEIDAKIKTIEELGGDVEELKKIKEELEAEKTELKKQSNIAWSSYRKVKEKVDGYQVLLKQKDKEIEELQAVNEQLFTENTTLKTEKNQLSSEITNLSEEKEELVEKVEIASRLKAEGIIISAVNAKGKEREGEFRVRQIQDIKVTFNLAENSVAAIEEKNIMIRIIDPDGNVIFDVAKGSGTYMYEGKEAFYTAQQSILFDNTKQRLSFLYRKGSEYVQGKHSVEVFADNYPIGTGVFLVK